MVSTFTIVHLLLRLRPGGYELVVHLTCCRLVLGQVSQVDVLKRNEISVVVPFVIVQLDANNLIPLRCDGTVRCAATHWIHDAAIEQKPLRVPPFMSAHTVPHDLPASTRVDAVMVWVLGENYLFACCGFASICEQRCPALTLQLRRNSQPNQFNQRWINVKLFNELLDSPPALACCRCVRRSWLEQEWNSRGIFVVVMPLG